MNRSCIAFNKLESDKGTDDVIDVVKGLKINNDSTHSKEPCRRSMLAASRGTSSFRLKGISKSVLSLTQQVSSASSATSSFQSLSDFDDEDSFCQESSLFDSQDMFDLAEENSMHEDVSEEDEDFENDEATAIFVTEYGDTPIAQFHCRQIEILCRD